LYNMRASVVEWADIKRYHWRVSDPITAFGLRMSIPFVLPFEHTSSPQFSHDQLSPDETTLLCAHVLSMVSLDRMNSLI
jgi:hypothetical protein